MHNETLNSPGHWFVAPYRGINGEQGDRSWVGPFIYDGSNGELIWSGAPMFTSNVADFRISNVNGERLMALFAQNQAVVLNNNYTIRHAYRLENEGNLNTHELNFIENGTRAIFCKNGPQKATREESRRIGYDGECSAKHDGFAVLDVTKPGWPHVFDWDSHGKIAMEESSHLWGTPQDRCNVSTWRGWDFM